MIATLHAATCVLLQIANPVTTTLPVAFSEPSADGNTIVAPVENVRRLTVCPPTSNCVSSSYLEPPNRYVSPLRIVNDRDVAFRRAVRDLTTNYAGPSSSISSFPDEKKRTLNVNKNKEIRIVVESVDFVPREHYVHLVVPGTAPGSSDDVELVFAAEGGVVQVRCEARVTLPPPPFCLQKNCINGNMDQRRRVDAVARVLGLPPSDEDLMTSGEAKWTPIFFNSDRVPETDY